MSKHSENENEPLRDKQTVQTKKISTFRRLAPQVTDLMLKVFNLIANTVDFFQILVAITKNLISFNKSLFDGISSIVIPALIGIAVAQNPNEHIHIEASQASWLCEFICSFFLQPNVINVIHNFGAYKSVVSVK